MSNTQPEPIGDKTWWLAAWTRYSENAECATILATDENEARQRLAELARDRWEAESLQRAEITQVTDMLTLSVDTEH